MTMLTEQDRELLSAAVDGELTGRQRKCLMRLLRRSHEARALLRGMQEDARQIRALPRTRPHEDLAPRVLSSLPERAPPPVRTGSAAEFSGRRTSWAAAAVAAAVLLAAGFGSYHYFTNRDGSGQPEEPIANRGDLPVPRDADHQPAPAPAPQGIHIARNETPRPAPDDPSVSQPAPTDPNPSPDELTEPRLGTPIREREIFPRAVDVKLDLSLQMRSLEGDRLRAELKKDPAFRFELPCRESTRAFEQLRAAFRAHGVSLIVDQVAQARLKQPKLQTNFVLYAEDVTPAQMVTILNQLGQEDKKAEARKRGDGVFNSLVVNPMSSHDFKELAGLLRVDVKQLQTRPATPLGVDIKKPVSEGTANQVATTLAGQGGAARPEAGKANGKAPETLALAVPYNPVRPRPNSPEVKRFFDSRKPTRPGTIQVLLVLRDMNG
jgi:hypothetical protein